LIVTFLRRGKRHTAFVFHIDVVFRGLSHKIIILNTLAFEKKLISFFFLFSTLLVLLSTIRASIMYGEDFFYYLHPWADDDPGFLFIEEVVIPYVY